MLINYEFRSAEYTLLTVPYHREVVRDLAFSARYERSIPSMVCWCKGVNSLSLSLYEPQPQRQAKPSIEQLYYSSYTYSPCWVQPYAITLSHARSVRLTSTWLASTFTQLRALHPRA